MGTEGRRCDAPHSRRGDSTRAAAGTPPVGSGLGGSPHPTGQPSRVPPCRGAGHDDADPRHARCPARDAPLVAGRRGHEAGGVRTRTGMSEAGRAAIGFAVADRREDEFFAHILLAVTPPPIGTLVIGTRSQTKGGDNVPTRDAGPSQPPQERRPTRDHRNPNALRARRGDTDDQQPGAGVGVGIATGSPGVAGARGASTPVRPLRTRHRIRRSQLPLLTLYARRSPEGLPAAVGRGGPAPIWRRGSTPVHGPRVLAGSQSLP